MSYQRADANDQEPELLTLMEAATILRIGRTTAYELAHQYLTTGGACGLPVVHIGKQLRVQRARLDEVIEHGTARRGESARGAAAAARDQRGLAERLSGRSSALPVASREPRSSH